MQVLASLSCGLIVGLSLGVAHRAAAVTMDCGYTEVLSFGTGDDSYSDDSDGFYQKNYWHMGGGQDTAYGLACTDALWGEPMNDFLGGGSNDDSLYGGQDRDELRGGDSPVNCTFNICDYLSGEDGNDELYDDESSDTDAAYGNADDDLVSVNDGDGHDTYSGGGGSDSCPHDSGDSSDGGC